MQQSRINYIVSETTIMHDLTAEIYEALMDGEKKEASKALDKLGEKVRDLKKDLSTKEH